jgi:hypothetical protein
MAMANNNQPSSSSSSSRIPTPPQVQGQGQRVFAPPGGGWNVGRPTKQDWDARRSIQGPVNGVEDGEDEWFRSEPIGRGASNRQLWDEA